MTNRARWAAPILAVSIAAGCGGAHEEGSADRAAIAFARATIEARSDSAVEGEAGFTQYDDGTIRLRLEIENASPGTHAAHLHETGDCSAPDATSAGGHWNPTAAAHGAWGAAAFHLGDLGNVEVGEDGTGSLELSTDLWSLGTGEADDIVGRAVIVHAGADDFTTQPTGGAGGRIGCGVIEAAEKADVD
jgi:Cu-Zn family superoxide dismutase